MLDLLTGDPSLNEIVDCSVSGWFIVTNRVLSRFSCMPNVSECVSILCSIVFINLIDLPSNTVSSAYSKSIRGSLAVCVCVGLPQTPFQHLCKHHS